LFSGLVAFISVFVPLFVDSFAVLFISRAVYGIAMGMATTLNTAVVAEFFEGDERVSVMGIQGASVGAGMVLVTTLAGWVGKNNFRNAYYLNIIGLLAFILLFVFLPETGVVKSETKEDVRMNKEVFILSFFCMMEFFFLITFNTNIAMHLSGSLAGDTSASGLLTGVFSGVQIVAGLILGYITKITKKMTMSCAMLSLAVGTLLISIAPSNLPVLIVGAFFCGLSQGVFIPTGMVAVSNAVAPAAAAMASAWFTCGNCVGQTLSPIVLNKVSDVLFGEITTNHIFQISAVGITLVSVLAGIYTQRKSKAI
jgi:MFS family permease